MSLWLSNLTCRLVLTVSFYLDIYAGFLGGDKISLTFYFLYESGFISVSFYLNIYAGFLGGDKISLIFYFLYESGFIIL